jgi:hypothetical protein
MSEGPERTTWEWHFLTRFPPRELKYPRYVDSFRDQMERFAEGRPDFGKNLRQAALYAIQQVDDVKLMRQGLQCLAHVGLPTDLPAIEGLALHPNSQVAGESKICVFEIAHTSRHFHDS